MKKTLIVILTFLLTAPTILSAKADQPTQGTLAIIDTALDTSLPFLQGKIAYEVCILDYASCENGKTRMEGPGAATMPISQMKFNGFEHGTMMVSAAVQSNPNIKIVFIRIAAQNLINGAMKPISLANIGNAMSWVVSNKDKFNIQAVAMSQGTHVLSSGQDYCPVEINTTNAVKTLLSQGIPTFFAVGNSRDYTKIDWPACINEAIAVGGTDQIGEIATYNNYDNRLDIYAQGFGVLVGPGGIQTNQIGSSISNLVAASDYMAIKSIKTQYTYQQIYDLIIKTSTVAKSARVPFGKSINIQGALNG